MERLNRLLARPLYRYLVIGGLVYVFELLVIVIAQAAGMSPVWSVAISFVLGTAVSFLLQKLITFRDKRLHHKIVIPQILATILLLLWNLGFTLLLTKLFERHVPAVVIRTAALMVTTVWNFYLYKTRIFKSSDESSG